jgi:protein-disulfide isomerase
VTSARREAGDLSSAPPPPIGPDDHVRGEGPEVIVYGDYECPFCAALEARLHVPALRVCFRHFPVRSSHPRAQAAACAAEAAARQGAFWAMHDLLFADQGRLEDPHLWARAERLGLDVERFDADRRGDEVAARVKADFRAGVRAGVATTPTVFVAGAQHAGRAAMDAVTRIEPRPGRSRTH